MKFDADMTPVDYMIVDGNAAFAELTGLRDANGKWVSEIAPGLERHWFELYGRVALTGEPARFEQEAGIFGRWYDVQALRIGDPRDYRVAILFDDISERRSADKRRQALIDVNDAFRDVSDPDAPALSRSRSGRPGAGGGSRRIWRHRRRHAHNPGCERLASWRDAHVSRACIASRTTATTPTR